MAPTDKERTTMDRPDSWTRRAMLATLALAVTAACATAPSAPPGRIVPVADLAMLAGEWEGTLTGAVGGGSFTGPRFSARVTVGRDGTFASIVDGKPGQGSARIMDGKLVYQGTTSRGTATLYDRDGRLVLRGEGTLVGYDGFAMFEMTRR
jgi:hypothetical protein